MKNTTSIYNRIAGIISINHFVVWSWVDFSIWVSKANKTLTRGIWTVTSSSDISSRSKLSILQRIFNNEVTISLKIWVHCLNTGWRVWFKKLTGYMLLFIPNTHISNTIKIGKWCWMVTDLVYNWAGNKSLKSEIHGCSDKFFNNYN